MTGRITMADQMWLDAARDTEGDHQAGRLAAARVRVAQLWPFLAAAGSQDEFEGRLALASEQVAAAVYAVSPADATLLSRVRAELGRDFRVMAAARPQPLPRPSELERRMAALAKLRAKVGWGEDQYDDPGSDLMRQQGDQHGYEAGMRGLPLSSHQSQDPAYMAAFEEAWHRGTADTGALVNSDPNRYDRPVPQRDDDLRWASQHQAGAAVTDWSSSETDRLLAAMREYDRSIGLLRTADDAPDAVDQEDEDETKQAARRTGIGYAGSPEMSNLVNAIIDNKHDMAMQFARSLAGQHAQGDIGPVLDSANALVEEHRRQHGLERGLASLRTRACRECVGGQTPDREACARCGGEGVLPPATAGIGWPGTSTTGSSGYTVTVYPRAVPSTTTSTYHPEEHGSARYEDVAAPARPDWIVDEWDTGEDKQWRPGPTEMVNHADGDELKRGPLYEYASQRAGRQVVGNPYEQDNNPYAVPAAAPDAADQYDPSEIWQQRQSETAPDLPGYQPVEPLPIAPGQAPPQPPDRVRQGQAARTIYAGRSRALRRVAAEAMRADPAMDPRRALELARETLRRFPQVAEES